MKYFITFIFGLTLISNKVFGQGHFPVIAMELQRFPIANNIVNGQPDISDSTIFNVLMKIVISDTTSINSLQVTLRKDIDEQTNLLSKSFVYDITGTFSDGTSFSRSGYEITLNLGNYMGTINPFAELIISNLSGNTTDPISYY